jgi:hypothetical protein
LSIDWRVLDIGNLYIDDIWDWFMSVIRVGIELFVPVKFRNKTAFGKKNKYPAFISHCKIKRGACGTVGIL